MVISAVVVVNMNEDEGGEDVVLPAAAAAVFLDFFGEDVLLWDFELAFVLLLVDLDDEGDDVATLDDSN